MLVSTTSKECRDSDADLDVDGDDTLEYGRAQYPSEENASVHAKQHVNVNAFTVKWGDLDIRAHGESSSSHTLLYFSPDFVCRYTDTDVIPCSGESSKETAVKYVSVMCDDHSVFIWINMN